MQELTHYIGGEHVKGTSGRFADVYNPATGEVQAKVPLASADEMAKAVDATDAKPNVKYDVADGSLIEHVRQKDVQCRHGLWGLCTACLHKPRM